jgi:hypothetical protein
MLTPRDGSCHHWAAIRANGCAPIDAEEQAHRGAGPEPADVALGLVQQAAARGPGTDQHRRSDGAGLEQAQPTHSPSRNAAASSGLVVPIDGRQAVVPEGGGKP